MLRKIRKNTPKTKKYLDSLPKIYGIFLWAKWGMLELPWTGKVDKNGDPLVYIYYDANGTRDEWHLVPIQWASSGAFHGWYKDYNTAYDIQLELNDILLYRNSAGGKYAEECVSCPHCSLCFQYLELAGDITRSRQPIFRGCADIKANPEKMQKILEERIAMWKKQWEWAIGGTTHAEGRKDND